MTTAARLKAALERHVPGVYASLLTLRARLLPAAGGEPELVLLPSLCSRGETAIDVGANHGNYSIALLRLVSHVIAVEPNPKVLRVLKARFRREIREGRLRVVEAALSASGPGKANLFIPDAGSALASLGKRGPETQGETIQVPLLCLDDLVTDEPVGFIKIDVEGHEAAVLRGALKLIANRRPTLLIEIEERHRAGALGEVRALLEPFGYHGFYLYLGRLEPIGSFNEERLQSRAALNAAGTRRRKGKTYVNNFIFSVSAVPCNA